MNEINSSNGLLSYLASNLGKVQRDFLQNFSSPTETVFCKGSRLFGGLRHFKKKEGRFKINHEAESPPLQELMRMLKKSGILYV